MSFIYDGSGSLIIDYNTISGVVNYIVPTRLTISEFIYYSIPTISGYVYGNTTQQYGNYTISDSFTFDIQTNDWLTDTTSNRFLSTFFKGFVSISGNLTVINGSINCNQKFNGISTNYFNILPTLPLSLTTLQNGINSISSIIFYLPTQQNYTQQINSISSLIYSIPNYTQQINSLSSLIYSIPTQQNYTQQINTLSSSIFILKTSRQYQSLGNANVAYGTNSNFPYIGITARGNVSVGDNNYTQSSTDNTSFVIFNTNIGTYNLQNNVTGNTNTTVGSNLLPNCLSSGNTAMGIYLFPLLTTGTLNLGIGGYAFNSLVSGNFNSGFGVYAGEGVLGSNNLMLGYHAGQNASDTNVYNSSVAIGNQSKINASNQIMLGTINETVYCPNALIIRSTNVLNYLLTLSSTVNSLTGRQYQNLNGSNVAFGSYTNFPTINGNNNVSFGNQNFGSFGSSASNNSNIGCFNLIANVSGVSNTTCGQYNLSNCTTGGVNTSVGIGHFTSLTSGYYNCGFGIDSYYNLISGFRNVGIGYYSGGYVLGNDNIMIGSNCGQSSTDTNIYNSSVAIGNLAIINSSNQIMLGTVNETTVILGNLILGGVNVNNYLTLSSAIPPNYTNQFTSISSSIYNIYNYLNQNKSTDYSPQINTLSSSIFLLKTTRQYQNLNTNVAFGSTSNFPYLGVGSRNVSVGDNNFTQLNSNNKTYCTDNTNLGSNNLNSNIDGSTNITVGNYLLPNCLASGNTAIGFYLFPLLTSGAQNNAIGGYSYDSLRTGFFNVGLGHYSGTCILGSYNVMLGYFAGQKSTDTNVYDYSVAIGYQSKVNSSHQIMLGTINETVYCPNALMIGSTNVFNSLMTLSSQIVSIMNTSLTTTNNTFSGTNNFTNTVNLNGTNITTYISSAISNGFTNFLSSANTFTGSQNFFNNNQYVGIQTFGCSLKGVEITMHSPFGVLNLHGLTTAATAAMTGVIQCAGGISASTASWFNGITTSTLFCANANVMTPIINCSTSTTLTTTVIGINQFITITNTGVTITFPDSKLCNGQLIILWNSTSITQNLACSGTGYFSGKVVNNYTPTIPPNTFYTLISNYYQWVVISIQ